MKKGQKLLENLRYLSARIGLKGAWIAMCMELSVRGLFFIIMLIIWKKRRCSEPDNVP